MVYIIRREGSDEYKIGYTANSDVNVRLQELQTGNARRLIVVTTIEGGTDVETEFHRRFLQYKTDGGTEWFDIPEEIISKEIHEYAKTEDDFSSVGGASPFDVRQVCWGQQYPAPNSRENVPDSRYGAGNSSHQYPILTGRREYEISVPSVLREER